ncbi:hypothetical protein AVEN_78208-1, partial [Araneus ventricosus]
MSTAGRFNGRRRLKYLRASLYPSEGPWMKAEKSRRSRSTRTNPEDQRPRRQDFSLSGSKNREGNKVGS